MGMTIANDAATAAARTAMEPRRLQILQLIWDDERSVTDIASHLPVTTAAVSQHLTRLKDAGLVAVRRDGRHRYYRATKADMGTLAVVLESFWNHRLDALGALAEERERSVHGGTPARTHRPRSPR